MTELQELLSIGLIFSIACFAGAVIAVSAGLTRAGNARELAWVASIYGTAVGVVLFIYHGTEVLEVVVALSVALAFGFLAMRDFTSIGRLLLVSHLQVIAWLIPFGIWYLATIDVSLITRALLFAGYPFVALTLPVSLISTYGTWEVLCRQRWRRPREALEAAPAGFPKISIHVPTCSEPPEVVIQTLRALAHLDYPNFEVLVIDNNTRDAVLWRPLEQCCRELGSRFRFFHVESLAGAKAGALNYALRMTAPDASIISVVDADYETRPDFLARLVGFFDDPKIGFVQTPHEYREWENSTFLRWCRWEYKLFFHTTMVTMNERDAALIVGTMCLIRRGALEAAGGWAEWCLTEDSELAIRIHAAGYSSVYVDEAFGRGLIPATLTGYKAQRYRWTYGPIQELRAHFRLLLPRPFGRPSLLTRAHKLHHLHHGLDRLKIGLGVALVPFNIGAMVSLLAHHEHPSVPLPIWLAALTVLLNGFMLKWQVYRSKGCPPVDALGALIAAKALSHTITMASIQATLGRPASWTRTSKFRPPRQPFGGLAAARSELAVGLPALLLPIAAFVLATPSALFSLLLLGVVYQALNFLSAPAMALLAEHHARTIPPNGSRDEVRDATLTDDVAAVPISR